MDRMFKAYDAARRILSEEMPEDSAALLREVGQHDVIVVRGQFDRVQEVLQLVGIRHHLIDPGAVSSLSLNPDQLLILNCPGEVGRRGVNVIRDFVEAGGSLFTTDWALKHVIEPAFPRTVAFNKRPTADEVVRIEVRDRESPFLDGVFHDGSDPLWWLEGSSYPIRILDQDRVKVLITSRELESRYGEAPVAVSFDWGQGEVFHMISHYYLQRAETRTARHSTGWAAFAAEKGAVAAAACAPAELDDLSLGEVEAAHSSLRIMSNVIAEKQRRNRGTVKTG